MFTHYEYSNSMTPDAKIEEKARGLGMHTKDECKVFFKGMRKMIRSLYTAVSGMISLIE